MREKLMQREGLIVGERRRGKRQRAGLGQEQTVTVGRLECVRGLGTSQEIVLVKLLTPRRKGVWPSAQAEGRERKLGRCLKQKDKV